jgi:ABC-2 type transport system permease protein
VTFRTLIQHEWRTRLSRPGSLVMLVLLALSLIYGAASGRLERDSRLAAIAHHRAEVAKAQDGWVADLRLLHEQGERSGVRPWAGSPMDATFASWLPPAPLADFSVGQSDLLPFLGSISLWDPDVRLFARYELEEPVSLALGGFDPGKAVLLILPLILIGLCFDVLSSDRDSGRLSLVLAQGGTVRQVVWGRLLVRAAVVAGITLAMAGIALAWPGASPPIPERLPFFVLWALGAGLYTAFWVALLATVVSRNWRGELNLTVLLLAWVALVLVLPATMSAVAEALYPTPSRIAFLAESREVEVRTEANEAAQIQLFAVDHPDLAVSQSSEIPGYVRTAFLVTTAVDQATQPILREFETTSAKRSRTLGRLRYLSPPAALHSFFNDVAGSSAARHRRYQSQARELKSEYARLAGPHIVSGKRWPYEDLASLPQFRFRETSRWALLVEHGAALALLAIVSLLLFMLADRRLTRGQ